MLDRHTHAKIVLSILRTWKGDWVPNLYRMANVMVHSRVADLRRKGHRIECRRFGPGDYRYRLVDDVGDARLGDGHTGADPAGAGLRSNLSDRRVAAMPRGV